MRVVVRHPATPRPSWVPADALEHACESAVPGMVLVLDNDLSPVFDEAGYCFRCHEPGVRYVSSCCGDPGDCGGCA